METEGIMTTIVYSALMLSDMASLNILIWQQELSQQQFNSHT